MSMFGGNFMKTCLFWHCSIKLNKVRFQVIPQNRWPQLVWTGKTAACRQTGHSRVTETHDFIRSWSETKAEEFPWWSLITVIKINKRLWLHWEINSLIRSVNKKSNKGSNTLSAIVNAVGSQSHFKASAKRLKLSHLVAARARWCWPPCWAHRRPGGPGVAVRGMMVQSATWHREKQMLNSCQMTQEPLWDGANRKWCHDQEICCHPRSLLSLLIKLSSFFGSGERIKSGSG